MQWIRYCVWNMNSAEINKENVVAVFFDIEKAYNMMWRETGVAVVVPEFMVEIGKRINDGLCLFGFFRVF